MYQRPRIGWRALLSLSAFAAGLLSALPAAATEAAAQGDAAMIAGLGEKALKLYDELDFQKAEEALKHALEVAASGGLEDDPTTARIHLYLGMVLVAGLQQRDAAVAEFKVARRIDPAVAPPPGLFNPEVEALFAGTRTEAPAENRVETGAPPSGPKAKGSAHGDGDGDADADQEVDEKAANNARGAADDDAAEEEGRYFLALGVGAGGGTAAGHIDMQGVTPNTAPGRFAMSELGHAKIAAGYFWSSALLVAVEARLQLVTGPTPHCEGMTCGDPSGFAAAALVKLDYFLGEGPWRGFGSVGVGGGTIRQVVKLTGLPDCGRNGDQQCFDTVTGGPLLLAAGGGVAYQLDSVLLLGAAIANVGVPNVMLNVDLTIGAGLRF